MKKFIGVFDSGLGGLTTVKELIRQMPQENIVFLADNKNMPYGSKTREEIRNFTLSNSLFLKQFNLKALIIACNTSESNARDLIEENIDVPVYGVIEPAVRKAIASTKNKRIGLFATSLTVKSKRYDNLLAKYDKDITLYAKECPKLVPLIENGKFTLDDKEMSDTIDEYLEPLLKEDIDTLILGCTHYDVLSDIIKNKHPQLNIVSSSRCVIDEVKNELILNDENSSEKRYFTTSLNERFVKVSKMIINDIEYENADI